MRILRVLLLCVLFPGMALSQELETLKWDPPIVNDLAGYRLYMALEPIPDDKGNAVLVATTEKGTETAKVGFTLPLLGAQVYFRVLAFNTKDEETEFSNEVSKIFPPLDGDDLLLRFLQGVRQVLNDILETPKP